MPALRGILAGAYESRARAIPTISAANRAADGTPTMVSGTVTATVIPTSSAHRSMKTSMPLPIQDLKLMSITGIPRYNLVMRVNIDSARATELRESMMALTRQMRRHRPDTGLTLSQL